ncbi:MAG: PaaI family thioesterase [Acidimicrobiales bacterium]
MSPQPVMTVDEINDFFLAAFEGSERSYHVEHIEPGRLRARQGIENLLLRPGGTVSGPTQMGLADGAAYALILAHIGPVALAVTSSLTIAFLRKPQPVDLIAEAEFLKLGRKLAVVDVRLRSDGRDDPIAQATVTYAIPSSEWA